MKIRLVRTGGIIPVKKQSETDVNWTEADVQQLKKEVEPTVNGPGKARDGICYHLETEGNAFVVDWPKIPSKYRSTLEKLKDKLVIEKQS